MTLVAVGVNYRSAPLALRERLAVPSRDLPDSVKRLRAWCGVDEAAIVSTCNRVECYTVCANPADAANQIAAFLASPNGLSPSQLHSTLYHLTDIQAVRHLFRVTAGLDSMILGESEITAQVKQAYQTAHAAGTTGPVLHRVFQKALHTAKVLRAQTRIGEGQASIGSVVVALARQRLRERLKTCEVLLWGAGKAAEVTARHLIKSGIGQLWIVNRTQAKSQDLAALCQGGWLSWEQALKHLAHVDIAIVCTQAPHYVVDAADGEAILPQRRGRPLLLIDLAVPRNVDPALRTQPGIHLYDIDDLQSIAQASVVRRHEELARCEALIEQQVQHIMRWWNATVRKEVVPCSAVEACSSV